MDELLKGRISILEPVALSGEARNTREMFAGTRAQTLDLAQESFSQAPDIRQFSQGRIGDNSLMTKE
jgi:hypothetical protein